MEISKQIMRPSHRKSRSLFSRAETTVVHIYSTLQLLFERCSRHRLAAGRRSCTRVYVRERPYEWASNSGHKRYYISGGNRNKGERDSDKIVILWEKFCRARENFAYNCMTVYSAMLTRACLSALEIRSAKWVLSTRPLIILQIFESRKEDVFFFSSKSTRQKWPNSSTVFANRC